MITVIVICDSGNTWATGFNGTPSEASSYFVGQTFTRELGDGTEIVDTCTSVEILDHDLRARRMGSMPAMLDNRYVVAECFTGAATIMWVASFCGERLGSASNYVDAVDFAVLHRAKFLKGLDRE